MSDDAPNVLEFKPRPGGKHNPASPLTTLKANQKYLNDFTNALIKLSLVHVRDTLETDHIAFAIAATIRAAVIIARHTGTEGHARDCFVAAMTDQQAPYAVDEESLRRLVAETQQQNEPRDGC